MVINKAAQLPALPDAGGLLSYFERIKSFPVLSEEEEQALILDFKQNHNLEAAHRLVVSHLRLAAKIALTYRHYGLPLADLISAPFDLCNLVDQGGDQRLYPAFVVAGQDRHRSGAEKAVLQSRPHQAQTRHLRKQGAGTLRC